MQPRPRSTPSLPAAAVLPIPERSSRTWRGVLAATVALAGLRLLYAPWVELAPQEAYYWQYARHPALSYFDHPPLTAWLITLSTRLAGTSELGIRLPGILGMALLTLLLFRLGERLHSPRAGALAAALGNASVLFGLGAMVMTPDMPLVVCWAAALRVLCELVLPDGAGPGRGHFRWYLLGALCGLALLAKYTAALLLPQVLLTALLSRRGRAALRTPHPYLALLVTLALFSPVLVWNAQHDWASFAFQTVGRASQVHGARAFLVGRYVGLQAVAVGPVLYVALWGAAARLARRASGADGRARLLALAGLPGLLLFTAVAPLHWVKMNWVAPCYVGLLVGLAWEWAERWSSRRVRVAAWSALVTGGALMVGTYLVPLVWQVPFPDRDALTNGWRELAAEVDAQQRALLAREGVAPLVVGWGYKTASELAFYLPGKPETQSSGALGGSGLQYDFWLSREALAGRDLLVVVDARQPMPDREARLAAHCTSAQPLGEVPVHRGPRHVSTFSLWHCRARPRPVPGT